MAGWRRAVAIGVLGLAATPTTAWLARQALEALRHAHAPHHDVGLVHGHAHLPGTPAHGHDAEALLLRASRYEQLSSSGSGEPAVLGLAISVVHASYEPAELTPTARDGPRAAGSTRHDVLRL